MEETPITHHSPAAEPPSAAVKKTARRRAPAIALSLVAAAALAGGGAAAVMLTSGANAQTPSPAAAAAVAKTTSALQADLINAVNKVGPAVVSIRSEIGLGSGVIYDASGLILTNAHVVDGASKLTVELVDGRHFQGRTLGTDTGFDLAVVKIDGSNLPSAELGTSSSLQVGEFVIAIGNPYGLNHTVTTGVVSAVNRPISEGRGSYNQPMVQTDAPINPGNSGGPLVDLQGNVIGINTLIAAGQREPAQGLGFAVPVDTAKKIAPQIVTSGHVTSSGQPYLGASISDIRSGSQANSQGRLFPRRGQQPQQPSGVDHGALIVQTQPGGPTDKAGITLGDAITTFDGREIYDAEDLLAVLVLHKPGDQVQVGFVRGGETKSVTLAIGEAPAAQG